MRRIGCRPIGSLWLLAALLGAGCAVKQPPETPEILDEALPETTEIPGKFGGCMHGNRQLDGRDYLENRYLYLLSPRGEEVFIYYFHGSGETKGAWKIP